MQEEFTQDAAKFFTQTFYAELQKGHTIEYAVAAGRSAIAALMPGTIDWCLPALYTNVGVHDEPPILKASSRIWQWFSQPPAQHQIGVISLLFGALHLCVGLLLLLSGISLPLPDADFLIWMIGGLAALPLFLSIGTYLWRPLRIPPSWSTSTRTALMLRLFSAASISLGLATLYWAGFGLILVVSLGFWNLLSPVARLVLLLPFLIWSILLTHSQVIGQGHAFITNAQVEEPALQWDELAIPVCGYLLLLMPLIAFRLLPELFAPPLGNVVLGLLLLVLGYALHRQAEGMTSESAEG
jgi:hypothetical protein